MNVDEFLAKNREKYEIVSEFQYKINHITQETYQETITFIESHSDIFFKDYDSAIFFFYNIHHFSLYNYKQLELILDIAVNFDKKMKSVNVTDYNYLQISNSFLNSLNYLFNKNLISISTISKYYILPRVFINFYPEIKDYDEEYAEKTINKLFQELSKKGHIFDQLKNFFDLVKSNPDQHKMNRIINYHPSILHQSIREDDITTFQRILSQNNFNVNKTIEKSFYERTSTRDDDLSLIQIAALYGSVNIFKFLWMQNDIILNENLQFYAYSGRNFEIIHICEQKCSFKGVLRFAIHTHQNDLVEYYLENFADQLDDDPIEIKNALKKFDDSEEDDQNVLKKLNYESLKDVVMAMNWQFILPCLKKIVFIVENCEFNSDFKNRKIPTLLERSKCDMNFFQFLYGHKNPNFRFSNDNYNPYFLVVFNHPINMIEFLLKNENEEKETLFTFFLSLCSNYPQNAVSILDFLTENKNESFISYFKSKMNLNVFHCVLMSLDDNLILKMLLFFNNLLDKSEYIRCFVGTTNFIYSTKMINSMVQKISEFVPKNIIDNIIQEYENINIKINIGK